MRLTSLTTFLLVLLALGGCASQVHEVDLEASLIADPNVVDPIDVAGASASPQTVRALGPTLSLVFLPEGAETLVVRDAPTFDAQVLDELDRYTMDVPSTGRRETVHGTAWVEVVTGSGLGWVPAEYTTAFVPSEDFCEAPAVTERLLRNLEAALHTNNADLLASLISPTHGLRIRYVPTEEPVRLSGAVAASAMNDAQPMSWGTDDNGDSIQGSFSEIVGAELVSVIVRGDVSCNRLTTGAASRVSDVPDAEVNLNFYSIHVPETDGRGDWVTWTVGVSFEETGAGIATLNRYASEG